MRFEKLIVASTLLAMLASPYIKAEDDPCQGAGQKPFVKSNGAGISEYSYAVDKKPPSKYSRDLYAHERFVLNKNIKVHLEHRGCPFPGKNQVHMSFSMPGKFKSYEDTQFWVN